MTRPLSILLLCLTASADEWPNYPGVPVPPCGFGTSWHSSVYTNAGYTFDYGSGAEAYRVTTNKNPGQVYTHFVDPSDTNATDTANTYGSEWLPRITRPNDPYPDGTVLYIHSGTNIAGWGALTRSSGTNPVFIVGNPVTKPEMSGGNYFELSSVVLESFQFDQTNLSQHAWSAGKFNPVPVTNLVIRHCEFYGGLTNPLTTSWQMLRFMFAWNSNACVQNVVIWSNNFHDISVGRTGDGDAVGISAEIGVNGLWMANNQFRRIGGDAFQVAADKWTNGVYNLLATNINYVGNDGEDHYENEVDAKGCESLRVMYNRAQNFGYGYGTLVGGEYGQSYPYRFGQQDVSASFTRSNILCAFNWVNRCAAADGAILLYNNSGENPTDQFWCFGNHLQNIQNTNGTGTAIGGWWFNEAYFLHNSMSNCDRAFNIYGDATNNRPTQLTTIVNNLVTACGTNALLHYAESNSLYRAMIRGNLWYDDATHFRVGLYPDGGGTASVTYYDWDGLLGSSWSGWTVESKTNAPVLQNNLMPLVTSPVIGAGVDISGYLNQMEALFGYRFDRDARGKPIEADPPIGAYDYGSYGKMTTLSVGTLTIGP